MINQENKLETKVKQGEIIYLKDNTIQSIKPPRYGEVVISVQDGKVTIVKRTETFK